MMGMSVCNLLSAHNGTIKRDLRGDWKLLTETTKDAVFDKDTLCFEYCEAFGCDDSVLIKKPTFVVEIRIVGNYAFAKTLRGKSFSFLFKDQQKTGFDCCSISIVGKWKIIGKPNDKRVVFHHVEFKNESDYSTIRKLDSVEYKIVTIDNVHLTLMRVQ